jgi:hypothetical protein
VNTVKTAIWIKKLASPSFEKNYHSIDRKSKLHSPTFSLFAPHSRIAAATSFSHQRVGNQVINRAAQDILGLGAGTPRRLGF